MQRKSLSKIFNIFLQTWSENSLKSLSLQSGPNSPAITFSICLTGIKSADSRTRSKIRDSSGLISDSSLKYKEMVALPFVF